MANCEYLFLCEPNKKRSNLQLECRSLPSLLGSLFRRWFLYTLKIQKRLSFFLPVKFSGSFLITLGSPPFLLFKVDIDFRFYICFFGFFSFSSSLLLLAAVFEELVVFLMIVL